MSADYPDNETFSNEPSLDCIDIHCSFCAFSRSIGLHKLPPTPVRATCPQCGNSFSFDQHLQSPPPSGMAAITAPARTAGKNDDFKKFLSIAPPLLIATILYFFDIPWYIPTLVLLLAPYWYVPVFVYFDQRVPAFQPLRVVLLDTPLPAEQRAFYDRTIPRLTAAGFTLKGRFTNTPHGEPLRGTVTLMQNQETSDVAHLLTANNGAQSMELIGFSRLRSDGSRIRTGWSNFASPFPPVPQDNTLRVGGVVTPLDLWQVHQQRVAADRGAVRNAPITDAHGYQIQEERSGVRDKIQSGQWQETAGQDKIRPTLAGAFLMCLRMLFPWKHLDQMRAQKELQRYLRR